MGIIISAVLALSSIHAVAPPIAFNPTFIHVVVDSCHVRPLEQGRGVVKVCPGGAL